MRIIILAACLSLICVPLTQAQDQSNYEALLIPVYDSGPGAFGSEWTSILRIFNSASTKAEFAREVWVAPCNLGAPCPAPVPPNTTITFAYAPNQPSGFVIYPPRTHAAGLQYQLRIRDLSRALLTWGTEIPVVRETEFRETPIHILDVPTSAEFRQTLRLYSLASLASSAIVRIYTQPEPSFEDLLGVPTLLEEFNVTLNPPADPYGDPEYPLNPSFARVDYLSGLLPGIQSHERVRVTVQSETPSIPIWAFVTVTNNETQHVTTLTPH